MNLRLYKTEKLVPLLVFIIGFWFFCLRILGLDLSFVPGDLGDSRFINFLLEHGFQYLSGDQESFWSATFMYPYENTIAISDNMMGTLPIYSFWRLVGLDQETAYQFWWMSICTLNFWVTYFVIKKWFHRIDLAVIVAFLLTFSVFNLYQLNYMQMIIRFALPITFYAATKLVDTGKQKYLVYYLLGLLIQFYCVIYTGFFLFYFSVGFILIYAIVTKRFAFIKELFGTTIWKKTALILLISLATILFLMWPYLQSSKELGLKLYDEVKWNIPLFNAYLQPSPSSLPWSWMHDVFLPNAKAWWLQSVFIGLIPLIFTLSIPFLWIYWRIKKIKVSKLILTLSIVIVGISLLFIRLENGLTLYAAIFKLPGMNSMRVLNRYMHVQMLLIFLFMISLLKNQSKLLIYGLLILLFVDNSFDANSVIRTSKSDIQQRRNKLSNVVSSRIKPEHKAFVVLNSEKDAYLRQIDAMMVSLQIKKPTVNAYSSSAPPAYGPFFLNPSEIELKNWLAHNNLKEKEILVLKD